MKKLAVAAAVLIFSLGNSGMFLEGAASGSDSRQVQNHGNARQAAGDYDAPLTEEDKKNINYMINTLSGRSMFGLLAVKSDLEAAGEATDHINPLTHLQYIFSDPELKAKTKNIGRVAWKRYVSDFGDALSQAKEEGKINDEILKEFAGKVNVSYDVLKPLYDEEDWTKFMNTLRDS
jgi:hypothetical protein